MRDCKAVFEEIIARDFSDWRYGRRHRTVVDCYALQHPAEYCRSAKSLAAHLTGLLWALEYESSPGLGRSLKRWLDGKPVIDRPVAPESRGELTIVDLAGAEDPEEHSALVTRWAQDVWEAWSDQQDLARQWLEGAKE